MLPAADAAPVETTGATRCQFFNIRSHSDYRLVSPAPSPKRLGHLAWYDHPILTGPQEGTNHKIETMKRQSYGFCDLEFFRLKILAIHEPQYAVVG